MEGYDIKDNELCCAQGMILNFYTTLRQEHTTGALDITSSVLNSTQPYPESLAVKSLSIWMLEVENSLYMA